MPTLKALRVLFLGDFDRGLPSLHIRKLWCSDHLQRSADFVERQVWKNVVCGLAQAAKPIPRCGTLVLFKIASESPVSMAACACQTEGCRRPYAQAHTFLNPALQGLEPNLQLLRTRLWNHNLTPDVYVPNSSLCLQTRGNLCSSHLQVGFGFLALGPSLLQLLGRQGTGSVCKSSWAACDEFVGEAKAKGPKVHSFRRLSPAGVQQLHLRRLAVENVNRLDAIPLHSAVVNRRGNGTH